MEIDNEFSILNHDITYITIVNSTTDTIEFISEIDKFLIGGSVSVDTVDPNDSIEYQIQIGLPKIIRTLINSRRSPYYIFPGMDRVLEYTNSEVREIGKHKQVYQKLDELYLVGNLNENAIWGNQNDFIKFINSYKTQKLEFLNKNESYFSSELKLFMENEIHYEYLEFAYGYTVAHYSLFDTIYVVQDSFVKMANDALESDKYDRPFFRKLIQTMGRNEFFNNYDSDTIANNISEIKKENIISFIDERLSLKNRQEVLTDYILFQKLRGNKISAKNENSIKKILNKKYESYYLVQDSFITFHLNEMLQSIQY